MKHAIPFLLFFIFQASYAQDKLVLYDNTFIEANILQVTDTGVTYTPYNKAPAEKMYIDRIKLVVILYADGRIEVMNSAEAMKQNKEKLAALARKENVKQHHSISFDVLGLLPGTNSSLFDGAYSTFGVSYEYRPRKQIMAHQINAYIYLTPDVYGSTYVSYAPKFFFNKHKIIRGYAGVEGGIGYLMTISKDYYTNFTERTDRMMVHGAGLVGMNVYLKKKFFFMLDMAAGYKYNYKPESQFSVPIFYRARIGLGFSF